MAVIDTDYYLNSANSAVKKTTTTGKGADQLTTEDFLNLMVAQMTNQSVLGSEGGSGGGDTDYAAQMAQFTTLTAMQKIQESIGQVQEYQLSTYAVSYVGKTVTIAELNKDDELETFSGVVEGVTFYDGTPQVIVNGTAYPIHEVMEVGASGSSSGSYTSPLSQVAGYIGQNVRILHEGSSGAPETINGVVSSVTLIDGKAYVIVGGKEYPASEIQSIRGRDEADADNKTDETDDSGEADEVEGSEVE